MPPEYRVRNAYAAELPQLQEIEQAAAIRFLETPYAYLAAADDEPSCSLDYLQEQQAVGLVWVAVTAEESVVGFVVADPLERDLYLHEVDVLPAHGQRGLGRRLVETVCEHARRTGYDGVVLSTFRDVPWNAPFYTRLGFQPIPEPAMTDELRAIQREEAEAGLPINERVLMRWAVAQESK